MYVNLIQIKTISVFHNVFRPVRDPQTNQMSNLSTVTRKWTFDYRMWTLSWNGIRSNDKKSEYVQSSESVVLEKSSLKKNKRSFTALTRSPVTYQDL